MSAMCVTLAGKWPLRVSLRARAAARGLTIVSAPADASGEPLLRWSVRGVMRTLVLPDLVGIRERISRQVVTALLDSMPESPSTITGTVLVPAAGICGPAATGPVNAVRRGPPLRFQVGPDAGVTVVLGTLQVQHTRCWLFALYLHGARLRDAGLHAAAVVHRLPAPLARDTARAADYLYATGYGADWPGVYLLDFTPTTIDTCCAELICNDAELVDAVLDDVMAQMRDR